MAGTGLVCSLWGCFYFLYRICRIPFWFVPVTGMAGISLVLFVGALVGKLSFFADLLLVAGLAGAGYFVRQLFGQNVRFRPLRPEEWCMAAGMAGFAFLTLQMSLTHYDNFSHWALVVKDLLLTGELPGADTSLIPFRDYPPGTSVFIFYICRYLGHSQGMMLLAQNSVLLACFFALFGIVEERRRFLLYSFLGMGCAMLSYLNLTIRINNLLVDFLLPLLALASIAYSCRERENVRLFAVQILLLGFTGIVKGTGIFFAGAAGICGIWRMLRNTKHGSGGRDPGGKVARRSWLAAAAATMVIGGAAPFLLWQDHVRTDLAGFEGKFQITASFGKETTAQGDLPEEMLRRQIVRSFLEAAVDPQDRAFQTFVLCTALVIPAALYFRVRTKSWNLLQVYFLGNLLLAVYYGGLLYLYLYAMPEEEAVRLAGFSRYACSGMTLFAGMLILCGEKEIEGSFAVDIDERGPYRAYASPAAKRRYQSAVLGTFLLGINFLYSEFNGLLAIREKYPDSLSGRAAALVGDAWPKDGKPDPRQYLVLASDEEGRVSDGEVRYVFRYFLWAERVEAMDIRNETAWKAKLEAMKKEAGEETGEEAGEEIVIIRLPPADARGNAP